MLLLLIIRGKRGFPKIHLLAIEEALVLTVPFLYHWMLVFQMDVKIFEKSLCSFKMVSKTDEQKGYHDNLRANCFTP